MTVDKETRQRVERVATHKREENSLTPRICKTCRKFCPYPFMLQGEQWGTCVASVFGRQFSITVRENFTCENWEPKEERCISM